MASYTIDRSTTNKNVEQIGISTSTLSSSATFTGTGFDVSGFSATSTTVNADQDGTLYIEYSWDNSNWNAQASYPYTANDNMGVRVPLIAPYARVVFTNGSTGQGSFRLTWGRIR